MADLTTIDKQVLEWLFQMWSGYVLDFSDRTMGEFFKDDVGVNIYAEEYNYATWSKANRMRGFWAEEDNAIVGRSILKLIEYIEGKIALDDFNQTNFPDVKLKAWQKIWNRLLDKKYDELEIKTEVDLSEEIGKYLQKAEDEIKKNDYDWAIGTLSTFLEEFFEGLYVKLTWQSLWESADFKSDFSKIKHLLNLAPDWHADQKIKQILSWFSGIVDAMDRLCNTMWDRHRKIKDEEWKVRFKPLKHHTLLILNSVKTLTRFLFDSYKYQTERKESLEKELLDILSSDSTKSDLVSATRVWDRLSNSSFEDIHNNKFVKRRLSQSDKFINKYLIKKYIETYNIDSRDDNSEFFGVMEVLYDDLTSDDVISIYNKYVISKNDQAIYLWLFVKNLVENKPSIVPNDIQKEVAILNSTKYFTFYSLFEVLVHQFDREYNKEDRTEKAKELKIVIKWKEKELVEIIKKYFSGWTIAGTDYTEKIIEFILQEDTNIFPLPDSTNLINDIINIIQKFPGENKISIWGKIVKLSLKWIEKIQKIYEI